MTEKAAAIIEEFEHSIEKLEFGRVLEMVAGYSVSERARLSLLGSGMLGSLEEIESSQERILELAALGSEGEEIPLSGWKDSFSCIESISAAGTVAPAEELLHISEAEKKAAEAARFAEKHRERLEAVLRHLPAYSGRNDIADSISRVIGPDGEVVDGASPDLRRIRRQLGSQRERMRKDFSDFISAKGSGKGYEFVTVRGERYVVSLPRAEARHVKGIVHQVSGSGASLYIEPLEFVEGNNTLETLIIEEKNEVARILGDLTDMVFAAREELASNQEYLSILDRMAAGAAFATRFRCVRPVHSVDGLMDIRQGRHPLLERRLSSSPGEEGIVGLDIRCGGEVRVVVISGPNAGGKTIALKTIGMMVLLDRCGLPVPCGEETVLPDHAGLFIDIGDDQSIDKSLSTFSSRIERLLRILSTAGSDSLVLIDEIGDGTDPAEGAAIACAALEELSGSCGRTIVTTHMTSLKGWAHNHERAVNATLEFDPEKIRPLYRMKMGIPGRSWGIEMAGRMGLPERIISRAKMELGEDTVRLEELLGHLEMTENLLRKEKEELLAREEKLTGLVSNYQEHLDSFEKERDEMVRKARKEALDIVTGTRMEMENLVREIRTTQARRQAIRTSKERIERRRKEFEKGLRKKKVKTPVDPEDLVAGKTVRVESLGKTGRVIMVDQSSKVFVELPGGLRVETTINDLSDSDERPLGKSRARVSWEGGSSGPASTELMVRGLEREDALEQVDIFIDRAVLQGLETVSIIHGVGKGILKRAIYEMLRDDPRVEEVHPGQPAYGGDGVAVVRLK